jgi:hypothetical protein
MKKILLTAFTLAIGLGIVTAQKPAVVVSDKAGWHKIGETTVDFNNDHDEVAVLLADRFAKLKFKTAGAAIEILDIDVTFTEGDKQNIRVGYALKKEGDESREIDLKGGAERSIKTIAFHYKTIDNKNNKKGKVEIWGKKTNTGSDAAAGRSANRNGTGSTGGRVKDDGRDVKENVKEGTKEIKEDVKDAARDAKKEAKEEGRELKKDAKKTDKEVKREGREVKKETRKAKEETEEVLRDDD